MTKQEMVERVHEVAGEGLSRKRTAEVVDAVFKTISESVRDDGKFFHPGFGTFVVKSRAARAGRFAPIDTEFRMLLSPVPT